MGRRGEGRRPGPKGWRRLEVANSRQGAICMNQWFYFWPSWKRKGGGLDSSLGQALGHLEAACSRSPAKVTSQRFPVEAKGPIFNPGCGEPCASTSE